VLGNVPTSTHTFQLHSNAASTTTPASTVPTHRDAFQTGGIETNTTTPAPAVLTTTPRDVSKYTQNCHGAPRSLTATLPPIPVSLLHSSDTLIAPPSDFWISASSIVTAFEKISRVPLHDSQVVNQGAYRQELEDMKLNIEGWLRQSSSW